MSAGIAGYPPKPTIIEGFSLFIDRRAPKTPRTISIGVNIFPFSPPLEKVEAFTVSMETSFGKSPAYLFPLRSVESLTCHPRPIISSAKAWAGNICPPVPPAASNIKGFFFIL